MLHMYTLKQVTVRFSKGNKKKWGRMNIPAAQGFVYDLKKPHIYVLPFGSKAINKKRSEIQNISLWDKITRWEQLNT